MSTFEEDHRYHGDDTEELIGDYELECSHCGARRNVRQYTSAGWVVGDTISSDPSNPEYGRCVRCLRYKLKVVKAPVLHSTSAVTGFTKIPEE